MRMETAELTIEGLIHDLNNVFQTIAESAELLGSDARWARLSAALHRSVERGQRIALSIVEQNRPVLAFASILRNAEEFVNDYLEAAQRPEVAFSRRIDPEFRVPGDPAAWERVLANLFLNSVEAGARNIEVTAADAEITVCDDGQGIAPDMMSKLFQPHVSTKSALSGIGLFVVRSIVEANGGTVSADNGDRGGAVFRIQVPAGQALSPVRH